MLQVKSGPNGPFKIKSIRKAENTELSTAVGSACLLEAGEGTDKPPC